MKFEKKNPMFVSDLKYSIVVGGVELNVKGLKMIEKYKNTIRKGKIFPKKIRLPRKSKKLLKK